MKKIITAIVFFITLNSCNSGVSKSELVSQVKSEINTEFSKRASDNGVTYSINSFDLLNKGGKEYSGILKTTEGGQEFTYGVDVTVDGDTFMWKIVE